MSLIRKPTESPKKPQGSCKEFHGRNPYNIFVAILVETMTPKRHFQINSPLDETEKKRFKTLSATPAFKVQ